MKGKMENLGFWGEIFQITSFIKKQVFFLKEKDKSY